MRRGLLAGAAVVCIALVVIATARPFRSGAKAESNGGDVSTALAAVERRSLSSQTQVDGTLGYAGSYTIVNRKTGTYTWLPSSGSVIRPGHALYRVDGKPVVLLEGHVPAYRALSEGMSGRDVRQLNAALVSLGYATRDQIDPDSDDFDWQTKAAVERLQDHLGVTETGSLALGDVVFEPSAMRITSVMGTLGGAASPGPVAKASSSERRVSVSLDAAAQSDVHVGDRVDITLADKSVTRGVVSKVGHVATTPSGSDEQDSSPTVDVEVRPLHPRATGRLDHAPVQVAITTDTVKDALVVPVAALLARPSGGYAVEVAGAGGSRRLVPVQVGLFDDADGLVQVTGALQAGQRVVVPASA